MINQIVYPFSEPNIIAETAVTNSDNHSFLIKTAFIFSESSSAAQKAVFLTVGKINWFLGIGSETLFWSTGAFNEVVALLKLNIDAYSIGETLNEKALSADINSIISANRKAGVKQYRKIMDSLAESSKEFGENANFYRNFTF